MFTTQKRAAVASALVVTALTAGCIGGLSADGSVDAAVVEERVEQRYAALDGYSASVTRTVEVGDRSSESSATVTVGSDDRRTVTYTAGPRAGETVVRSADDGPVFDAALAGSAPSTPAGFGALAASLVSASNVSVDRVTNHDGHRTAVVELTPSVDGSAADRTHTVWVDLDRRVPLQVVTSWTTASGEQATVTVEYDDVTLYEDTESGSAEVVA